MRIAFDYQIFLLQRHGGVSRYFVELYEALLRLDQCEPRIFAPFHFNSHLNNSTNPAGLYLPFSTNYFGFNSTVRKINISSCKRSIKEFRPEVIHETFYEDTSLYSANYKKVTTVHDLTRERLGVDLRKIQKKKEAIRRSDHIVTVSKSTTTDLLNFYDVDPATISTIYVGVSDFFQSEPLEKHFTSDKPYILFVGHRDGYKNWQRFITAYSKSDFLRSSFSVHCFGGGNFKKDEVRLLNEFGLEENIKLISGGDEKLRSEYQSAACLVYPSLYEGFGSPVIEAMASGCPVFASRISALLESGGEAARFFDPYVEDSIIDVLETGLGSPSILSSMVKTGRGHASQFTWQKTASETLKVYESVAINS
jgi:glycosyltransferase involved in cell wall biosynthesis